MNLEGLAAALGIDSFLGGVTEWDGRIGGKHERRANCDRDGWCGLGRAILTSRRGLRQDMRQLREDMARLESRLEGQINDLRGEVGKLRERMSHLEGLLEGLREAISGRAAAS